VSDPLWPHEASPFAAMGGDEALVERLVARFYARMAEAEPELARLHKTAPDGSVERATQQRFGLFLLEWLGGPPRFSPTYGHPRLRMRHARVPIDEAMRDAWLRCMQHAMDEAGVSGEVRVFLDGRFAEVADFLRNR
jgi:hemoglobin